FGGLDERPVDDDLPRGGSWTGLDVQRRGAVLRLPADVDREREDVGVLLLESRSDERHRLLDALPLAELALAEAARTKHGRNDASVGAPIDLRERTPEHAETLGEAEQRLTRERGPLGCTHREPVDTLLEEEPIEGALVLHVEALLALRDAIERGLRDVEV